MEPEAEKKELEPTWKIQRRAVLSALRQGMPRVHACDSACLPRRTFYAWLDADPGFADEVLAAEQTALSTRMAELEHTATDCALTAFDQPRFVRVLLYLLQRDERRKERLEDREERHRERLEDRRRPPAPPPAPTIVVRIENNNAAVHQLHLAAAEPHSPTPAEPHHLAAAEPPPLLPTTVGATRWVAQDAPRPHHPTPAEPTPPLPTAPPAPTAAPAPPALPAPPDFRPPPSRPPPLHPSSPIPNPHPRIFPHHPPSAPRPATHRPPSLRHTRRKSVLNCADCAIPANPEPETSVSDSREQTRNPEPFMSNIPTTAEPSTPGNFIRDIVERDLKQGTYGGRVVTRFPPEPNGYLHIGHVKSIVLNFGLAEDYGGRCNLRMDDTNPQTEDMEYVHSILEAVRWLGYDWGDRLYYASDYFDRLYELAERLIRDGKAYVDSQTEDEIRAGRGTVTEPGAESPYRSRTPEENLDLFRRMKAGEFPDGAHVLRAKGDMASPNMKMRDPLLYRIRHAHHYRSGDTWCIYPMYDYAHPLSDAIEGVTHSLCTLEFDNNREIYDWVVDNLFPAPRPHQYEFARLNLDYTVLSKRKLLELVKNGHVAGWDDPRMPTVFGMRRRGVTPEALRDFSERVGVARVNSRVDLSMFDYSIRNDLNFRAPRVMAVLRPLKLVVTNYPEGQVEELDAPYWPHDVPKEGSRKVPFSRTLFIERDDFMENPPKKYHRLSPGAEVRLRYGYLVTCTDVVKDAGGEVVEVHCTYDPATRGGDAPDGRKVKGTIHWLSADHALPCEVRLYDRLFTIPDPDEAEGSFTNYLNPESLVTLTGCFVEPSVASDPEGTRYQFERQGYFWPDPQDSTPDALVFNRIIGLRDSWSKLAHGNGGTAEVDKGGDGEREQGRKEEAEPASVTRHSADPLERLGVEEKKKVLRYTRDLNLQLDDALILAENPALAGLFEEAIAAHNNPPSAATWITNVVRRELKDRTVEDLPFSGAQLGRLVALVDAGEITSRIAKDVFNVMLREGGEPARIVEEQGMRPVSDAASLGPVVEEILSKMPDKVEQYRSGKTGLISLFVGQVMRATGGKADPEKVAQMLKERLELQAP